MSVDKNRELDPARVTAMSAAFSESRGNRIARNAVTSSDVLKAARNPTAMRTYRDTYGIELERTGKVTMQSRTGRCWMFATYNVARTRVMRRLDVDHFELSQAFGMFYDKLEKANSFLVNVCEMAARPVGDRELAYLLDDPIPDGGEFRFAANLIRKYGVVPKDAMPETACSRDSGQMNYQLARLLRRDAAELRRAAAQGEGAEALDARREEMLADVHRMLCCCLGEPPQTFDLEVRVGKDAQVDDPALLSDPIPAPIGGDDADDRRVLLDRGLTPVEFQRRYVGFVPEDYVEMCSVPCESTPFGRVYGIRLMDSVVGGDRWRMLNVPVELVESACVASLRAGVPCYMACDVSQQFGRGLEDFPGVLACDTMDLEGLFDVRLDMDRTEMFDMRETSFTHAMTFQGVQLAPDGRPEAWRVENSWGKDACKNGYLIMGGEWFRSYGGYAVVERRFLEGLETEDVAPDAASADTAAAPDPVAPDAVGAKEALAAWNSGEICELDPWSPMGSAFARGLR